MNNHEPQERAVRLELTLAEAAVKNADREAEALRVRLEEAEDGARREAALLGDKLEAAGQEARHAAKVQTSSFGGSWG